MQRPGPAARLAAICPRHQASHPGKDPSHPGTPVVAVSLGDSAEFVWKRSWRRSLPLERLVLRSGDVLIFGGAARGMVHGVERILEGSGPGELRLGADPGWRRVCITCREH